jgi:hypothetical protein
MVLNYVMFYSHQKIIPFPQRLHYYYYYYYYYGVVTLKNFNILMHICGIILHCNFSVNNKIKNAHIYKCNLMSVVLSVCPYRKENHNK